MFKKIGRAAAMAALLTVALSGCAGGASDPDSPAEEPNDGYGMAIEGAQLMVADSTLGEIVVDAEGMTVYMFDSDTQGAGESTCEGQCATNWPAVTTEGDPVAGDGVTGELGTITGVDGSTQVTLNGWPLYYFAADAEAGDVSGQAVNDVWWVLSPDGERMAE
ncbi:COG4315 family predicted lipoprotein [Microbacterium sp. TWP3-1-2b2]|uniref:COG4315 family predicted lipoprotein n=1 Tax=Microbacterium sp. TWP3-1-2b2 TaxID=2804651 RepID=UPI003CF1BBBF